MFTKNKPLEDPQELTDAIEKALVELQDHKPYSAEYIKTLEQIEKLMKFKAPQPELQKPVSLDTVLTVAGNLAGIVLVLGYERAHVLTSKAFGLIIRPR
jgi:hypothetical protein